jgi:hypothetical protein
MMEEITISKFKETCLRLLDNVKRTGQPIALVTPPPPPKSKAWLGSMKDTIKITGISFHLSYGKTD